MTVILTVPAARLAALRSLARAAMRTVCVPTGNFPDQLKVTPWPQSPPGIWLIAKSDPPTVTVTPTPVPGSISGTLSFPSEFIPSLRVVAFSVDGFNYRYVDTMQDQGTYQITGLAPGKYHIVAYVIGGAPAGGYTQMVPCGLSADCTDHSLIDVTVEAGKDTPNVNPADWYAPDGTFPPMP
jgi:hypothetical protein